MRAFKSDSKAAFVQMPLVLSLLLYLLFGAALFVGGRTVMTGLGMFYDKDSAASASSALYRAATKTDGSIPISQIVYPKEGVHYARLQLPHTDAAADVYYGDNTELLKKGIGQYMGSAIPGYGAPILLAGHNNTYFNALKTIARGDLITLTTHYGVYQYRVQNTRICRYDDASAYDLLQAREQLILYTCYPFDQMGLTDRRFYVYADKVSGPTIVD